VLCVEALHAVKAARAGPAGRRGRPPTLLVRRRERLAQTTGAERAWAGEPAAGRYGRGDRVPRPPHLARSRADAACSEGSRAPPGWGALGCGASAASSSSHRTSVAAAVSSAGRPGTTRAGSDRVSLARRREGGTGL